MLSDAAGLPEATLVLRRRPAEVLPWSTATITSTHQPERGDQVFRPILMGVNELFSRDDHFLHLAAHFPAMMAAVSSMIWLREAMMPFIRHLTTSAPVFFMRLASRPR